MPPVGRGAWWIIDRAAVVREDALPNAAGNDASWPGEGPHGDGRLTRMKCEWLWSSSAALVSVHGL